MTDDERHFDLSHKHRLLDPRRAAHWDPPAFLARLGIEPGQTALDLGCGNGFWTHALAELAGLAGSVWAVDASQELLDDLAASNPPPQVRLLRADLPQTGLPAAVADLAWLAFVYHEVVPPEGLAAELRRVVRPGGQAAILEWRPDAAAEPGPPPRIRLWPAQVIDLLRSVGFGDVGQTWQDDETYLVVGR